MDLHGSGQDVIALTHVCRAWRQLFTSRSTLWTELNCSDADKTRVYLERSKSFPISLSLYRNNDPPPHDPLFQITPHAVARLKSLYAWGTPSGLQDIAAQLSHPAPILEDIAIVGSFKYVQEPEGTPTLSYTLFGRDLPSLRELRLEYVRTELLWKNMVNLTSLTLIHALSVSTGQLLDFFENTPHLREAELLFETPTSGVVQSGRLVSLAYLKEMQIDGDPPSVLLNHLLIPVGARLTVEVDLPSPPIRNRPPRFFDNLRNLPNFTTIRLYGSWLPSLEFNGPNGEVIMLPAVDTEEGTDLVLDSLDLFDTTKAEQLEIYSANPQSSYLPYQALLPMKDLRTLTLYDCGSPHSFIRALDPSISGVLVCPKLKILAVRPHGMLNIKDIIRMAAARESGGAKLKTFRIIGTWGSVCSEIDLLELGIRVGNLEC